jgi:hypothetical protein
MESLKALFEATPGQIDAMRKIMVYAQDLEDLTKQDAQAILDDIRVTLHLNKLDSLRAFSNPRAGMLDEPSAKFLKHLFDILDDDKIGQVFN